MHRSMRREAALREILEALYQGTSCKVIPTNRIDVAVARKCREISDPTALCTSPLVSVLVRAYNAEKTLARTIESIVAQRTDFPFEVIVSDDASRDGTLAIACDWQRRHADKIRVLTSDENVGLSVNDARTHCFARGAWIAECDSDDWWIAPHKLQKQYELVCRTKAVLCVTDFLWHSVVSDRFWVPPKPKAGLISAKMMLDSDANCYFQTDTFFYSAKAYSKMVRESTLPFEGDLIKCLAFTRYGKVCFLPDVTSVYNVGEGTCSGLDVDAGFLTEVRAYLALALDGVGAKKKRDEYGYMIKALQVIRTYLKMGAIRRKTGNVNTKVGTLKHLTLAKSLCVNLALWRFPTPRVTWECFRIAKMMRRLR